MPRRQAACRAYSAQLPISPAAARYGRPGWLPVGSGNWAAVRRTRRRVHLVGVHELHGEPAVARALKPEAGVALQQHVRVGVVHRVRHLYGKRGRGAQGL